MIFLFIFSGKIELKYGKAIKKYYKVTIFALTDVFHSSGVLVHSLAVRRFLTGEIG